MHILLNKFHQGKKYTIKIASHRAELRREGKFTDQKSLFITSLQTGYLTLYRSSGSGRNDKKANRVQKKCTFVEVLTIRQKNYLK